MWHEKTNSLDPILTKLDGIREGERGGGGGGRTTTERGEKEEEEGFRERSSHFSLDFPTIGLRFLTEQEEKSFLTTRATSRDRK